MRRKWDDQSVAQLLQTFTGQTNGRAKCVKLIYGSVQQNHGFCYRIIILLSLLQIFGLMCDWIGHKAAESHLGLLQQVGGCSANSDTSGAVSEPRLLLFPELKLHGSTVWAAYALKTELLAWTEKKLLLSDFFTYLSVYIFIHFCTGLQSSVFFFFVAFF